MVHTAVLQLVGSYSGGVYGFCDKGIDIGKLFVGDFNINTAKYVDGVNDCLPVECCIIIDPDV